MNLFFSSFRLEAHEKWRKTYYRRNVVLKIKLLIGFCSLSLHNNKDEHIGFNYCLRPHLWIEFFYLIFYFSFVVCLAFIRFAYCTVHSAVYDHAYEQPTKLCVCNTLVYWIIFYYMVLLLDEFVAVFFIYIYSFHFLFRRWSYSCPGLLVCVWFWFRAKNTLPSHQDIGRIYIVRLYKCVARCRITSESVCARAPMRLPAPHTRRTERTVIVAVTASDNKLLACTRFSSK